MFWTWNSGYIMAKLEGSSPVSNQPDSRFEYHIGGFKNHENEVKKILLAFPGSETLDISSGKSSTVKITADANAWFDAVNPISIATNPVCSTPGSLAKLIAENYYHMFDVVNVENH